MQKNRRTDRILLLILVITSVFFIFSCGEPSFININEIEINKTEQSSPTCITFSAKCKGTETADMKKIKNGPGLIIGYLIFDNANTSDSNIVNPSNSVNQFENEGNYFNIQSDFNSSAKYGALIFSDYSNDVIFNTTIGGKNYQLKSFNTGDGNKAGSPVYHYNISTTTNFDNLKFSIELTDYSSSKCFFKLKRNSVDVQNLSLNYNFEIDTRISIVFFSALTTGTGDFSSSVFSDIKYIGTISIHKTE